MERKIKIFYVMDHFYSPFGGTEGQIYNLIKKMDRSAFYPELCLFRRNSDYFETNTFPCKVHWLGIESFFNPLSYSKLFRLRTYIQSSQFDIVQTVFNDAALSIPPITKGLDVKVVSTRRDMGFWYTPSKLFILRRLVGDIDFYLVNSQAVKTNVMRMEGVPGEKVKVIYNGHDLERFMQNPQEDFYERLSIPHGAAIIGIVANFRPVKRITDLMIAFKTVLERFPECYLVFVGHTGDMFDEYESLMSRLGIRKNTRLVGMVADVIPLVKHFSVGVICSESEGMSNSIIEYMGCGIPVIASNIEANREVIRDETDGYLYPVGDTEKLSSCIMTLLEHEHIRVRMTRDYMKILSDKFDLKENHVRYEEFYRDLMGCRNERTKE